MPTKTKAPQDHRAKGAPSVRPMHSIQSAAKRFNVSESYIRKMIAAGDLKIYRRGKIIRIDPDDLDACFRVYGGDAA